jgi:hypothetical protein
MLKIEQSIHLKISVFWDVMTCYPLKVSQCSRVLILGVCILLCVCVCVIRWYTPITWMLQRNISPLPSRWRVSQASNKPPSCWSLAWLSLRTVHNHHYENLKSYKVSSPFSADKLKFWAYELITLRNVGWQLQWKENNLVASNFNQK